MKRVNRKIIGVVAVAATVAISGCQSTGGVQDNVAGAGIGAVLGCGVGALITRNGRGCAVGAAIGAAAGLTVVAINHYQARQVRTSSADRRVYGLTKRVNSPQVKINKSTNSPRTARVGQTVDIATVYSLRLPPGDSAASVNESWVLKQNGKTVASLPAQTNKRTDGGWEAEAEIAIPKGTAPGTYVIEHKVKVGSSYDTRTSKFVVKA
jgi:hypothetical protein